MQGQWQWDSYVKSNLTKYRHKEKTQKDVLMVFESFRDLRPKKDTYIFNDGSKRELLAIEGTIPVFYKGNTYNIPVGIWLMDTHPDNPPLCFVKPLPDMLIKPSKYVDANGRIYLPYLHDWKYPTSDLIGLIQVMSAVFGENSPVFARGSQQPPRPTHTPAEPTGPSNPGGDEELTIWLKDHGVDESGINEFVSEEYTLEDVLERISREDLRYLKLSGGIQCRIWDAVLKHRLHKE